MRFQLHFIIDIVFMSTIFMFPMKLPNAAQICRTNFHTNIPKNFEPKFERNIFEKKIGKLCGIRNF